MRELLEGEIGKAARRLSVERRRKKKEGGEWKEGEEQKEGEKWKEGEGQEDETGKGDITNKRKARETSTALSQELEAILGVLDLTPLTLEQIRVRLPEEYQNKQIITYLMRLCMEELAVQVSPGCFCRVRN